MSETGPADVIRRTVLLEVHLVAGVILKGIGKVYPGGVRAVTDFNLKIKNKEFIVFVGPSGCGKSTTLRMIAGLEEISEGELYIDDRLVNDIPPKDRDIAMVFQNYALYPHMTVFENMAFGLKLRKFSKEEIKRRVDEAARILDISHLLERRPKALSGGQRQRVALGRAIVREPKVFLLDEPLSNLDAKLRVDVRSELRQIQQSLKISVIYVTHDQDEALSMSDYIAVMRGGRLEQVGTPWQIYFQPVNRFVADFVGTVNFLEADVTRNSNGCIAVRYQGMHAEIPSKVETPAGGRVTLVVRPECMRLVSEEEETHEALLTGEIERYSFLGRVIRYWVKAGDATLIIDDSNPDLTGPKTGNVRIAFDLKKMHVLKAEGS